MTQVRTQSRCFNYKNYIQQNLDEYRSFNSKIIRISQKYKMNQEQILNERKLEKNSEMISNAIDILEITKKKNLQLDWQKIFSYYAQFIFKDGYVSNNNDAFEAAYLIKLIFIKGNPNKELKEFINKLFGHCKGKINQFYNEEHEFNFLGYQMITYTVLVFHLLDEILEKKCKYQPIPQNKKSKKKNFSMEI